MTNCAGSALPGNGGWYEFQYKRQRHFGFLLKRAEIMWNCPSKMMGLCWKTAHLGGEAFIRFAIHIFIHLRYLHGLPSHRAADRHHPGVLAPGNTHVPQTHHFWGQFHMFQQPMFQPGVTFNIWPLFQHRPKGPKGPQGWKLVLQHMCCVEQVHWSPTRLQHGSHAGMSPTNGVSQEFFFWNGILARLPQWTPLGARHDRTATYGRKPFKELIASVDVNFMLVMFPLDVRPVPGVPLKITENNGFQWPTAT